MSSQWYTGMLVMSVMHEDYNPLLSYISNQIHIRAQLSYCLKNLVNAENSGKHYFTINFTIGTNKSGHFNYIFNKG